MFVFMKSNQGLKETFTNYDQLGLFMVAKRYGEINVV